MKKIADFRKRKDKDNAAIISMYSTLFVQKWNWNSQSSRNLSWRYFDEHHCNEIDTFCNFDLNIKYGLFQMLLGCYGAMV